MTFELWLIVAYACMALAMFCVDLERFTWIDFVASGFVAITWPLYLLVLILYKFRRWART